MIRHNFLASINIKNWSLSLGILGLLSFTSSAAFSVLPGSVVVDQKNYWGHNGRLAPAQSKGSYIVCDGYIGSPLIPSTNEAIAHFAKNCEITPPPGSLPIIDVAENHSSAYRGYPAYLVRSVNSNKSYFVCDGFLNSTAWCSHEAHTLAQKLRRAAGSRAWEVGSAPIFINNQPANQQVRQQMSQRAAQPITIMPQDMGHEFARSPYYRESSVGKLIDVKSAAQKLETVPFHGHKLSNSGTQINETLGMNSSLKLPQGMRAMPINPNEVDLSSLPQGAYITKISAQGQQNIHSESSLNIRPSAPTTLTLSEEVKSFLVQTVEQAVDRALDRRMIR